MGPKLQATPQDYLKRCRLHLVHRKKDDGSLFVVVGRRRMEGWQIGNIVPQARRKTQDSCE